ncbi:hypothetical protein ACFV9D_09825 [Streptomyces sp. NPDC059875]|uniref:hypothetical protein n=1 Tax=unclassified Streptomyces TaxID=2593676 RepID=UPI0036463C3A
MRRIRALVVGTVGAALLAAGGTGCGPGTGSSTQGKATASRTSASVPAPVVTHTPSASASASASPTSTPKTSAPSRTAPPTSKPATRPPVPTYLSMRVAAPGGRLSLKPGGAAQGFTVTLDNGNTRAYRHLLLAFQMEAMPGGSAHPAYTLERWDRATGTWRPATLRIANDAFPYALYEGGTPLAKDAAPTYRYRVRALTGAPPGPNPVLVSLIDTDTDTRASYASLPQTTLD